MSTADETQVTGGPVWRTPGMAPLAAFTFLGFAGYAVLLPLGPLWVVRGGAGETAAGLVNGVMLLFTALTPAVVPALLRRLGWVPVLVLAVVLLGVPALAHLLSDDLAPTLALSAVRGTGLGMLAVAASAAVFELVPAGRRGAGVGFYGLCVALPNLVLLPGGPLLVDLAGFTPAFLLGALPLAGLPAAIVLGRRLESLAGHDVADVVSVSGSPPGAKGGWASLLPPVLVLMAVTTAGGAIISFAPQMIDSVVLTTVGLTVMGAAGALSRWLVGTIADRHGATHLLLPLSVVTVVALAATGIAVADGAASPPSAVLLIAALLLLGTCYGGLQNLTLVVAFERAPAGGHRVASAAWNMGFDLGTALGAVLLGVASARVGFGYGLLLLALATAAAVPAARARARA